MEYFGELNSQILTSLLKMIGDLENFQWKTCKFCFSVRKSFQKLRSEYFTETTARTKNIEIAVSPKQYFILK